MAETVIGTAGIFVTLALIAILSFVVGLVIYGVCDWFRTVGRSRKHSHRRHMPALRTSPSELADAVHAAALAGARALVERTCEGVDVDPLCRWRVLAEMQFTLMRGAEGRVLAGMAPVQRSTYRRVFRALCAETLATQLPTDARVNVFALMQPRLSVLEGCRPAAGGALLHVEVMDACEAALRETLGDRPVRPAEFRSVLEDVISSAVMLDLVRVLG